MTNVKKKQYLLWFANEHLNFRAVELYSVANVLGVKIKFITEVSFNPFCIVELENDEEDALKLASRCVGLKSVLELWGSGYNYEELHSVLKQLPRSVTDPYFEINKTFKVFVETFCKTISQKEKIQIIETFNYLPIEGPANLKNPDIRYYIFEYYGRDPNSATIRKPEQVFFSRWIADGQRHLLSKLSLKNRKFIGNTSMDVQLSLLMANQAQIKKGDIVYDPFVGSGSLLVAAAQFGGYVMGSDIDYLMLHGRSRPVRPTQKVRETDESVKSNLEQYGLKSQYVDVIVADAANFNWKSDVKFDVIITDPPYGIRESTEKIGSWRGENVLPISEEHIDTHIPSKVEYNLQTLLIDLLDFAATNLILGGRITFWLPIYRIDYDEIESIPSHDCLQLESNCEQVLCGHTSRRLLTMIKIREPQNKCETVVPYSAANFRFRYFAPKN